jgi:Zn-dependent protease
MAITIHEAAHAHVANWLGDNTPKIMGRLSFSPLVHLDPWGTLIMVFAGIGWGRAVQFNPYNLKNPRRDTAFIALAGPLSNILLAVLMSGIIRFVGTDNIFSVLGNYFITLNLALAFFNMLPIEPLDGFKILAGILPPGLSYQWQQTSRYGMFILIILLLTGAIEKIIFPLVDIVSSFLL